MKEVKFNLNQQVKVKLHPDAKEYYKNLHQDSWWTGDIKEDEEGYSKWQLWSLMEHSGHLIYHGNIAGYLFSTEIILCVEGE